MHFLESQRYVGVSISSFDDPGFISLDDQMGPLSRFLPLSSRASRLAVFRCLHVTSSSASSAEPAPQPQPQAKPFSEMPTVKGLPLLGCALVFIQEVKKEVAAKNNFTNKLHSELGPVYRLKMPGRNSWMVCTTSPDGIEEVFRAEGKYPSRSIEENFMWIYKKLDLPPPMFFSLGEVWKKTRSNAAKQVVPRRVGNFVQPLSVIADELLSHLEKVKDESGTVQDITPELQNWAFQGVSYFVYGEKIDIYSGTDPDMKEFAEAGLDYINMAGMIASALPLYRIFPTKAYRDYAKCVRRLQNAGQKILSQRYKQIKEAVSSGTVDNDKAVGLLDQWLIEGKFSKEEALSLSYDMLSAGIDTTSNTATFMLYELAKHPEIQDRLVQEISSVVGDKEHPSWEDLQKLTLVRNCVKETMRLYDPTGGTIRVLARDATVSGYHVPAGVAVIGNTCRMALDEQMFENPTQFVPDRWYKDSSAPVKAFTSLPFGYGPRACYGRRLAELELYLLLAKMIPKYHLTTNLKNADLKLKQVTVLRPAVPIPVNFHPR